MSCLLTRGHKVACDTVSGTTTVHLASHSNNIDLVKDTSDESGTFASVADVPTASQATIEVTTSTAHNLQVGQVITHTTGGGSGTYNGDFRVLAVGSTTTYQVLATFSATDSGSWAWETAGNVIIGTSAASGLTMSFVEIEQRAETAELSSNGTGSAANGSLFYTHMMVIQLYSGEDIADDDDFRTLIEEARLGRFVGVGIGNDGVHRIYGIQNGLTLVEGSIPTGVTLADLNGAILTFTSNEPEQPLIYDPSGDASGSPVEAFNAFAGSLA